MYVVVTVGIYRLPGQLLQAIQFHYQSENCPYILWTNSKFAPCLWSYF